MAHIFNKIGEFLKIKRKNKCEKITKPYILEIYRNETQINGYEITYDNSENVLLDCLKNFAAYDDYKIVFDLAKNKIMILFTVKKTGNIEI